MTSTCPRGHLLVRRSTGRHTVYLDELTHTLAISWLRERHRRWPLTANPHLLVTGQTAADAADPPIALTVMDAIFGKLGLSPSKLRQDRILDEARHTADPVHLMRVFGLTRQARHALRPGSPSRTPLEVKMTRTRPAPWPEPATTLGFGAANARNQRTCALSAPPPRQRRGHRRRFLPHAPSPSQEGGPP